MDEQLAKELRRILAGIKILAPESLLFAGEVTSPSRNEDARAAMIQHLGRLLYLQCYCRRFTGEIDKREIQANPDDDFVKHLSAANSGREYLNRGWRIIRTLSTGHFVAEKNGLTRLLFAGEFISHADVRGAVEEHTPVSIFRPRESTTMHPGFYYVFGEAVGDDQDEKDLLRFYWNINVDGAMDLVGLLTRRLNRFHLPFRFKILNNPGAYIRTDAAILYLNRRFYHLAAELLSEIHHHLVDRLNTHTPLFAKQLARGLGLGEEPTTGESFGQQRCRILAQALWIAFEKKLEDQEAVFEQLATQLEENGIDPNFPYRNVGSNSDYDFPV